MLTNFSARRALLLRAPISESSIHQISIPPAELQGRGGAVTLLHGGMRFKIILAYFPPRPWKQGTNEWRQTGVELMKWWERSGSKPPTV